MEAAVSSGEEHAVRMRLARFGEAESLATPVWEERGTSVRAIEAQLAHLWAPPADDGGNRVITEKGLPHARASVLNLIVTVVDATAADRVVHTMMELGIRHPSRAIVLVADPEAQGEPLDARISTHCHPTGGEAERVCYEEVVLTVRGEAARHLSGIVAPLLIHDLPTHVWWPGDPPFGHAVFGQLVDMADRLIVDSSDFEDLLTGYRRLSNLRRRSGVGDLLWDRLGWWQELTAEFFDAPRFRRYLPNLNRLWLSYAVAPSEAAGSNGHPSQQDDVAPGVRSPMSQALLYAGWLASCLGWKRDRTEEALVDGRMRLRLEGRYEMIDLALEPVVTDEYAPGELINIHMRALGETGAAEFIIDRNGDEATVATNADGMTAFLRCVSIDEPSEADLLSTDLITERNEPVYEAALRAAAIFLAAAQPAQEVA